MDTIAALARVSYGAFIRRIFLLSVAAGVLLLSPTWSHADEIDDAWAELNAKTAEIEGLTLQLEQARGDVDACHRELESVVGGIVASQEKLSEVQKRLASASKLMYKVDDLNIWQIITSSTSIDELLSRISQLEAVASQAAGLAAEEKAVQEQLDRDYAAATQRKDEAMAAEEGLRQTKETLESSAAALEEHIAELEEEAALAAAAAEAAAALEAAQRAAEEAAAAEAAAVVNANVETQGASEVPVRDEAPEDEYVYVEPEPEPEPEAEPEPVQEQVAEEQPQVQVSAAQDTTGWSTGIASAYGGSSDPYTPNPGTTATGAVCDDYSMGVAVPMAWGPTAYYGRTVEISYNGMVVVATVNDCGGMGGGSRALDLQPGVVKAFGFSTCQEWGLREVSYRFL